MFGLYVFFKAVGWVVRTTLIISYYCLMALVKGLTLIVVFIVTALEAKLERTRERKAAT